MPIANIIDKRTNSYDTRCDCIFEPSCHDNDIEDAAQFDWSEEITYEELLGTTVYSALVFAEQWNSPVTMFLYDIGKATEIVGE